MVGGSSGVELADGRLRVIHAMVMRAGYLDLFEEAKALGRRDEAASVSVTLNYVATNGRIAHVARGLYGRLDRSS